MAKKKAKPKKSASYFAIILVLLILSLVSYSTNATISHQMVLGQSTTNIHIDWFRPPTPIPKPTTTKPNPTQAQNQPTLGPSQGGTPVPSQIEPTVIPTPDLGCPLNEAPSYLCGGDCGPDFDAWHGVLGSCSIAYPNMGQSTQGCSLACIAKPVVYFYPTNPTYVDVSVETSGQITVSDPTYPIGGWKHVLAYPNGKLIYNNKEYSELFYETSVDAIQQPQTGIILPTTHLRTSLTKIITTLGLTKFERDEFIQFWLPRLQKTGKPYIFFSLMDAKSKEQQDKLMVNPKPDTFITFIAYFKPLDIPITVDPLVLPKEPPKRVGFTVVEWGGTLDRSQTIY